MNKELIQKLEKNWEIYYKLVSKIKNTDTKTSLLVLCDNVKDRLAASPASTQTKYTGAYPGGLVEHSLNVLKYAKNINEASQLSIKFDSLVIVSLFHDLGKIGNEIEDYYLEKNSDWHNKIGIMYEVNENISNLSVYDRSIWWLNKYKVSLTEEELSAILSLSNIGHQMYSGQFYNSSALTITLQTAIRLACLQQNKKTNVLE